jgi:hypothetical protein
MAGRVWNMAAESTAGVTALYATLVYFQLREMRLQRQNQEAMARNSVEEQRRRRPILRAEVTRRPSIVRAKSKDENGREVILHGLGCYITLTLTNVGLTTALRCQPVLTAVEELRSVGDERIDRPSDKWIRDKMWMPLPLLWSLDDTNIAKGEPTSDRDLVPRRPYLFDLGCCSTFQPDIFSLQVAVRPFNQRTEFMIGIRRFEVTVFSENAEPLRKLIKVHWHGRFVAPGGGMDIDNETLLNPSSSLISKLSFDDLELNALDNSDREAAGGS